MLTPAQVQEFIERGAVTVDTPVTGAWLAEAAAAVDRLAPFRPPAPGEQPFYTPNAGDLLEPALVNIVQHPFFEDAAKAALAADAVRFFQATVTATHPQPGPFTFHEHVDIQYRLSDFRATPRRIICTFFIWFTDVNARRAPTMFRPGSHLLLAAENERRPFHEGETGSVKGASLAQLPELNYAEPIPITARAGQASVLTTGAIHAGSTNVNDSSRRMMTLTFIAAGAAIALPEAQAQRKRDYDRILRPRLRPERRHIVDAADG